MREVTFWPTTTREQRNAARTAARLLGQGPEICWYRPNAGGPYLRLDIRDWEEDKSDADETGPNNS